MRAITIAGVVLGAIVQAAQPAASRPVRWMPWVGAPTRTALEAALKRPPSGLAADDALDNHDNRGDNHPVRTCEEYARAKKNHWTAENNAQIATESYFIKGCDLIRVLLAARPSRVSYVADLTLDASALDVLPPSIGGLNDEGDGMKSAIAKGWSLKQYDPALKVEKSGNGRLVIADEMSRYDLEIAGYGDFNGDGVEDVLMFQASYAVGGSMHIYEPVILTRTAPGKILSTVDPAPSLRR
jgi:hypothetical protein